jgi:hypothetical protein
MVRFLVSHFPRRRSTVLKGAALGLAAYCAAMAIPGAVPGTIPAASAANLLAHRATYVIGIAPDSKQADLGGIDGMMALDLKDTCDGWAVNLKARIIMTGEDGEAHTIEISQVTWEAKDGSSFRFLMKNEDGGVQQFRGEARVEKSTGAVTVISDLPAKAEAKLPDHTLFPMAHNRLLLEKAAASESVVSAELFDGTSTTQAIQVSALIGPGERDWKGLKRQIPELAGLSSYPIGLAFYFGDDPDATPDAEQFERLYENGVAGEIGFKLHGVDLRAVLDQFQVQKDPGC